MLLKLVSHTINNQQLSTAPASQGLTISLPTRGIPLTQYHTMVILHCIFELKGGELQSLTLTAKLLVMIKQFLPIKYQKKLLFYCTKQQKKSLKAIVWKPDNNSHMPLVLDSPIDSGWRAGAPPNITLLAGLEWWHSKKHWCSKEGFCLNTLAWCGHKIVALFIVTSWWHHWFENLFSSGLS